MSHSRQSLSTSLRRHCPESVVRGRAPARQMREIAWPPSLAHDVLRRSRMLRSIIAIWCVALGLLIVAATAGCGDGCANGDSCSVGSWSPPDLASSPDLAPSAQCPTTCPACASGEFCFQTSVVAELPAFCARGCTTDDDCKTGEICAALFASLQPPVCISAGSPKGCGTPSPTWHCDQPPASCKDANTLQKPFSHTDDMVCGTELVHCANGCATDHCL